MKKILFLASLTLIIAITFACERESIRPRKRQAQSMMQCCDTTQTGVILSHSDWDNQAIHWHRYGNVVNVFSDGSIPAVAQSPTDIIGVLPPNIHPNKPRFGIFAFDEENEVCGRIFLSKYGEIIAEVYEEGVEYNFNFTYIIGPAPNN